MAATRWSESNRFERQWAAVFAISISFGFLIHLAFSTNFVRYYAWRESRASFLQRNVAYASIADWVNANLRDSARVGTTLRSINYLLDVPYLALDPAFVAQVEMHPRAQSLAVFVRQLDEQQLTHLLVHPNMAAPIAPGYGIVHHARRVVAAGCAVPLRRLGTVTITSRTMGLLAPDSVDVLRLTTSAPACKSALGRGEPQAASSRP